MLPIRPAALALASLLLGIGPAAADDLLARWQRADALCALPPSPMTEQACQDRERTARALVRAGWCETAPATPFAHWGWQSCGRRAVVRPHHRTRRAQGKA
ncbi:hypothetical protein [Methylobacterium oryzisoli]|uniref:hypothetical protein n=1 Tax=Methylobacterium oryzisoli TaxID=3385502 RepID=UPI00389156DF